MKCNLLRLTLLHLFMLFSFSGCNSNTNKNQSAQRIDRQSAVAWQFYPGEKKVLQDTLKAMFRRATQNIIDKPLLAVISPHAGYVFSGDIAASSFSQVKIKHYQNIFIIGSSHYASYGGAAIYCAGDFITPLGKVKVDIKLSKDLIKENSCFVENNSAHGPEHSIEVQLPFLQYILGDDINLVPILIGTQSENQCQQIAKALKPFFNSDNLFVISTDFSHYPGYYDAQTSDKLTAQAIMSNSPEKFMKTINDLESSGIPNLQTAICGWTSALTLLNITHDIADLTFMPIISKNSGDTKFGDKEKVVGYCSIAVVQNNEKSQAQNDFLTPEEKKSLLQIARKTIESYVINRKIPEINNKELSKGLLSSFGAFVTLKENGELRGCIGNFSAEKPLYQTIQDMAIASATNDYRFNPVSGDEISKLSIEISVLTPMKKINSIDEIILGKHGIYIKKGTRGGTFLPQVAKETGWSKEEFLGHCARDKAGLEWNDWKIADIYIYEAIVFGENIDNH